MVAYLGETTDKQGRSQNLCHFYPDMGLKFGVFRISCIQYNRGSSGGYVTCIDCGLSVKINTPKYCTARKDHERSFFAFVHASIIGKNLETPNLSPWLMTPLQGAVYEVWDLHCISVGEMHC